VRFKLNSQNALVARCPAPPLDPRLTLLPSHCTPSAPRRAGYSPLCAIRRVLQHRARGSEPKPKIHLKCSQIFLYSSQ